MIFSSRGHDLQREKTPSKLTTNAVVQHYNYVYFRTKTSKRRKICIPISNDEYKLKVIKQMIWRNLQLANRYRYFFRTWCQEIEQEILDEGWNDNQVVPKLSSKLCMLKTANENLYLMPACAKIVASYIAIGIDPATMGLIPNDVTKHWQP